MSCLNTATSANWEFPPSSIIVTCQNGQLHLKEEVLKEIVGHSVDLYGRNVHISLLAIVGSESKEKEVMLRSFLEYYEGKSETDACLRSAPSLDPKAGGPLSSSSSSAIHILEKPFHLEGDGGTKVLLWVLYLKEGEGVTPSENTLFERFLLRVSSRIAGVNFEGDQLRIFQRWKELTSGNQMGGPISQSQLCRSFLFVLLMEGVIPEADEKQRIFERLELAGWKRADILRTGKVLDFRVFQVPKFTRSIEPRSFSSFVRDLHDESGLGGKSINGQGQCQGTLVQLGDFVEFVKDSCAFSLDAVKEVPEDSPMLPIASNSGP